jgi:hypothetical protein
MAIVGLIRKGRSGNKCFGQDYVHRFGYKSSLSNDNLLALAEDPAMHSHISTHTT